MKKPVSDKSDNSTKFAISVDYEWSPLGSVLLDDVGNLRFPKAMNGPGLYRFEITSKGVISFYTGQAENLSRRFQHYRTPGNSQQTNKRLKQLMIDALSAGGDVSVSIVTEGAKIEVGGKTRPVNLGSKFERNLFEHAAIAIASSAGFAILNRG